LLPPSSPPLHLSNDLLCGHACVRKSLGGAEVGAGGKEDATSPILARSGPAHIQAKIKLHWMQKQLHEFLMKSYKGDLQGYFGGWK
jgi:hypothetical protein